MRSIKKYSETRRQVAYVGIWNTLTLDYRNPYVVTFWSIAYAGFGHIITERYIRGYILLAGELFLNLLSNLNSAIFYSLTNRPELAKEIINYKALFLYIGIYCFAIFDSYKQTVANNNYYRLADRENAKVKNFAVGASSYTSLQEVSPYAGLLWSAVIPGTGSFMIQRMNRAFLLIVVWMVNSYLSGIYSALIYTFAGKFDLAMASLDIHWLLNLPSIWVYGMYEAYTSILENNKLYKRELFSFLDGEYQNTSFTISDVIKEA